MHDLYRDIYIHISCTIFLKIVQYLGWISQYFGYYDILGSRLEESSSWVVAVVEWIEYREITFYRARKITSLTYSRKSANIDPYALQPFFVIFWELELAKTTAKISTYCELYKLFIHSRCNIHQRWMNNFARYITKMAKNLLPEYFCKANFILKRHVQIAPLLSNDLARLNLK